MRIGVFSDVHANIEALNAVLKAYENEQIDVFFCLGDIVGYGGSPNECCDLVRKVAKVTILGNHDAAVAGRMDYSYYYEAAREALDLHARQLTPDNMKWLKSLPYKFMYDQANLLLCHGSPVRFEDFEYIFATDQAQECFEIWEELGKLTVIGHSHLCKVFELRDNEATELAAETFELKDKCKYVVSVGSVGQPRDYDNRASYTIFDTEKNTFEFKRIEYDIESAAAKVFANNLESNFGHRLYIGV